MKTIQLLSYLALVSFGMNFTDATAIDLKKDMADRACRADVELHCKGVEPGEGRIKDCLKEHHAELSEGCKAKGEAVKEAIAEKKLEKKAERAEKKAERKAQNQATAKQIRKSCKADTEKFCKKVFGPAKRAACLGQHMAELSEECKAVLQ
jgi:hypothetical protein